MDTLPPELVTTLTLTGGLALAMVWLGKKKAMLEERAAGRRCPCCGRLVRRGACSCYR